MSATGLVAGMAFAAGALASMQIAVMGRFGDRIGAFAAISFALLLQALIGVALLAISDRSLGGYMAAMRSPIWLWPKSCAE